MQWGVHAWAPSIIMTDSCCLFCVFSLPSSFPHKLHVMSEKPIVHRTMLGGSDHVSGIATTTWNQAALITAPWQRQADHLHAAQSATLGNASLYMRWQHFFGLPPTSFHSFHDSDALQVMTHCGKPAPNVRCARCTHFACPRMLTCWTTILFRTHIVYSPTARVAWVKYTLVSYTYTTSGLSKSCPLYWHCRRFIFW